MFKGTRLNPMNEQAAIRAYRILVTASDGSTVYWHKNGVLHEDQPAIGSNMGKPFQQGHLANQSRGGLYPAGCRSTGKGH